MKDTVRPRLLIVDDEAAQMRALCDTLQPEGYETTGFVSGHEAIEALHHQDFDLLLTDLMMPEMDGITLLQEAFEIDPNLVGIVMTGHGTIDTAVEALKAGALDYILKPFRLSAVLPVLSRALAVRRLRIENIQLRQAIGVYEVSATIAIASDSGEVLRKLANTVLEQSQARNVSVLLLSDDRTELRLAVTGGEDSGVLDRQCVPFDHDIANWVKRCCESLSGNEGSASLPASVVCPCPALSGISVPMLVASRLVGILSFDPHSAHRSITLGQLKALNILAGAAASAWEASSLLDQLRAAERRYRRLADNAPDVVFRYDLRPRPCFAYVNRVIKTITGHSQEEFSADPNLVLKIVHAEDQTLMEDSLLGRSPSGSTITMRWVNKDGKVAWVEQHSVHVRDATGTLVAVEGIARDITERKSLEDQLRHAQKMEVIGRLAGGVAHDLNNLLTVIDGYTEMMLDDVSGNELLRGPLDEVRKAGERAGALTRQLLAFGRKQANQPRTLNLNKTVRDSAKMLQHVLGEDIEIATVLDPTLACVKADDGQIEQVLLNLAINARDAMPQGGRLTVETHNAFPDDATIRRADVAAPEVQFVVLILRDSGSGMDQATQSRIFEPFFTTKGAGRGTGLGLSIVHGIVHQHGGKIEVQSRLGQGTTFKVYLPRAREQEPTPEASQVSQHNPRGSESILVVEDDSAVRRLISAILREAGYRVVVARNGRVALQIYRGVEGKFAMVLTDLFMPQMSGPALIEVLQRETPRLKVLYTSGHPDDGSARSDRLNLAAPLLQKPFSAGNLLHLVRAVLDSESQTVS